MFNKIDDEMIITVMTVSRVLLFTVIAVLLFLSNPDEHDKTSDLSEECHTPFVHSTQSDGSMVDEGKDGQSEKTNDNTLNREGPQVGSKIGKTKSCLLVLD